MKNDIIKCSNCVFLDVEHLFFCCEVKGRGWEYLPSENIHEYFACENAVVFVVSDPCQNLGNQHAYHYSVGVIFLSAEAIII